jgi:ribosomal subunit interface protein
MRVDVSFKYLEKSEIIENVLEKNIARISRRIKMFRRDDPIHISIHVEKNPNKEQYYCRSHIYLPSKVITAEEKATDASRSINKAFAAITRQLDKLKHKIEAPLRRGRQKLSKAPHEDPDEYIEE